MCKNESKSQDEDVFHLLFTKLFSWVRLVIAKYQTLRKTLECIDNELEKEKDKKQPQSTGWFY